MKKALSLSLALLMSALLFVGCAKADEKAEVVTTTEVSSDVPETKTSETTTEAPETEATTTEAPVTKTPEETELPEETTTAPVTEAPTTEATTIATTATTTVATTAKAEVPTESRITLSGNASDKFTADKYCYAESDKVILYFEKGVEIRGDMLKTAEEVIADLENYTGLMLTPQNFQNPK